MLKNIVVIEANNKDDVLCQVEIHTPSEFMFASTTEQILNCSIFDDFIDEVFLYATSELRDECMREHGKKIQSVYVTFINNEDDSFICSIILDRMKPKRGTYRVSVNDWQATGCTLKYADPDEIEDDDLKPQF